MIVDIQNMIGTKRIVYGVFLDDKAVYIGQTKHDALTRIAQHLSREETIRKYVKKNKVQQMKIEILYSYKNKVHENFLSHPATKISYLIMRNKKRLPTVKRKAF